MKYEQQDVVVDFLMGLNDNFAVVKPHILVMDLLPKMNRAFSMAHPTSTHSIMRYFKRFIGEGIFFT